MPEQYLQLWYYRIHSQKQLKAGESANRKASSEAERARSAVTRRIKQATEKFADAIPALGHHLHARIKTGYFCSYNPHPDRPVAWKF